MPATTKSLALRNLAARPARSLLTVLGIALGVAAMTLLWGFHDGLHRNMVGNFQEALVGSLQIHRAGYFLAPRLDLHMSRLDRVHQALDTAGVSRWSERIEAFVLATGEDRSSGLLAIAIDPERESRVTALARRIGTGLPLSPDDREGIVLGAGAVAELGVTLGDEVALLTHDRFGMPSAERFVLRGILTSGELGLDRGLALIDLAQARTWLEMEGQATTLVARVEPSRLQQVAAQLQSTLNAPRSGAETESTEQYEVMTWDRMFPVMAQWIRLDNGFHYVFLGVVMALVVVAVLNTAMVSVLERTREFGIQLALGAGPSRVRRQILTETALIGALGTLTGGGLGALGVAILGHTGVDLSLLLKDTIRFYVSPRVYPVLDPAHFSLTLVALFGVSLAAGLYPAWRTARLRPIEALRHV